MPALSLADLPARLKDFCLAPRSYRLGYQQSSYDIAFDGYSYPGQTDSLNQGPEDQLHSFVFSDFSSPAHYPSEFQGFIKTHWGALCAEIQAVEQSILLALGLDTIARQQRQRFGHMMSANYYPDVDQTDSSGLRLSPHPDVSLLTVFLQGLGEGFQYQDADGQWRDPGTTQTVTVFAGELLEWLTDGAVPALKHRVRYQDSTAERYSFALFSLPQPGAVLHSQQGKTITTEGWYRLHLSQWDDPG